MAHVGERLGRPTELTKEIANEICVEISTSNKSLKTICTPENMPSVRTVLYWLTQGDSEEGSEEHKSFLRQYARAKENQADFLAEEIIDISDHVEEDHTAFTGANVVQRDKLRIDARKWVASKLRPKKYGDRIDHNHEGGQTIIVKYEDEQE